MRRFVFLVLMTACGMPAGLDTARNNPIDPQADPTQQRCGNGIINSGEECDDENIVATDSCTDTCKLAFCGDGYTRTDLGPAEANFEFCDNGDSNSDTSGCLKDCRVASCGDNHVRADLAEDEEGYEACDDANDDDTDACTNGCLQARCGDGIVRADGGDPSSFAPCPNGGACSDGEICSNDRCVNPTHEVCDDGNSVNDDGCSNTCQVGRCGDGVIQPGEECDAGETPSEYCTQCKLKRCDSGCFDALDPESTDHCVRVPLPGGQFVNACLPAQGAPTAVPAPLGVCRSEDGSLDTSKPCARDADCEDESYSCDIRPAWHRCVTSEPNRLHGFLQSCIPDEDDCSDGLLCSPMVARRWHGFCDVGESSDGWYLTGYQAQIPGRGEVVCYPSACEGVGVDDSADQPTNAQANACPHLNGFNGQSTQNTYCAAGEGFTEAQQGACLWEECLANEEDDEESEAACEHHEAADTEPARCTSAEVCGYATDEENAPAQLYPLDLTHPFNLSSFADRCASACMFRGAACFAVHDGLSPVAQAQCMVCDDNECCPDGTVRVSTARDDDLEELSGLCLRDCVTDRDCSSGFECSSDDGRSGFCMAVQPEGREFVEDGRAVPVSCDNDTDCVDSLCLPMVTSNPDSPNVCQLKLCRNEWDCPMTQNCGGGRCRQDILCGWGELSCGPGASCSQTQLNRGLYGPACANDITCAQSEERHQCYLGVCGVSCQSHEDCGGYVPCLNGLCVLDHDFGTCRLPSFGLDVDADEPIEITPVTLETFSEGFMLEGDFYREVHITPPNGGLLWFEGYARTEIRCSLTLDDERIEPTSISQRFNMDPELCSGWYAVEANQVYTLRVRLNHGAEMSRPPTQVLLEGQYVQNATIYGYCTDDPHDGRLDRWEGCVDDDPNDDGDGCIDCRCERALISNTPSRELPNNANWHWQESSYLGCHHGREDQFFEATNYPFEVADGEFVFIVSSGPNEDLEGHINCSVTMRWTQNGEDSEESFQRSEALSTRDLCVVVITQPQSGGRAEFFTWWDGAVPASTIPITLRTGMRCLANSEEPCPGECREQGNNLRICAELNP